MMILRILLGVACLSLLNASQAEAQLFRRLRGQPQPQPQYQPQAQPRYQAQTQPRYQPRAQQAQPQRYVTPQTGNTQNGYQGQLTASSQRNRPVYLRRADGSVVRYYPNNTQRAVTRGRSGQAQLKPGQNPAVAATGNQRQPSGKAQPNLVTTQGQLTAVRPPAQPQQQLSSVYRVPDTALTAKPVEAAPVGISVLNQPNSETVVGSIAPAAAMPEATMSQPDPASSIPISTAATNPAPTGLSLSLADDIVPASAEVAVEPSPAAGEISDTNGEKTFSVLETID